ncbi:MAG: dethiobiotin synthase [Methylomicrobium sp.]|nr:dethiobiotin synthase [Methylomicrobium sp.]
MNKQNFFITGTDTGAGKTWSTAALMHHFKMKGNTVIGMKPVASGCEEISGRLRNEDALLLQELASVPVPYELINPYAFREPVAPHLAANGQSIDIGLIHANYKHLQTLADVVLIEGAGGWLVPLGNDQDWSDLVMRLNIPVIIVVALKLGCINHARLTHKVITDAGIPCAGWIAACVDETMLRPEETLRTLVSLISAPLLGVFPFQKNPDFAQLAKAMIISL